MRVLDSVSRGDSCRKEENEDARTPGYESQLGPEEKPRACLVLPYLWHADAILGRNVRLTPTTAALRSHWYNCSQKGMW